MSGMYRSPYEAYPFLSDPFDDLRCDFEILTDEMASGTGLLRARLVEYLRQNAYMGGGPSEENGCGGANVGDAGMEGDPHRSTIGAKKEAEELCQELLWICGIIYHINPTLRTRLTITSEECERLRHAANWIQEKSKDRCRKFVLPVGGALACEAHALRVKAKKLVRLIYRHMESGGQAPDLLLDVTNLLSGYFFYLALYLNSIEGIEEIPFESRNYK